jgi:hypothetical protein
MADDGPMTKQEALRRLDAALPRAAIATLTFTEWTQTRRNRRGERLEPARATVRCEWSVAVEYDGPEGSYLQAALDEELAAAVDHALRQFETWRTSWKRPHIAAPSEPPAVPTEAGPTPAPPQAPPGATSPSPKKPSAPPRLTAPGAAQRNGRKQQQNRRKRGTGGAA